MMMMMMMTMMMMMMMMTLHFCLVLRYVLMDYKIQDKLDGTLLYFLSIF
jgi:succinate dehydrogenase hydrophobic anchor subunit